VPAQIAAGQVDNLEVFRVEAEQDREEIAHLEPDPVPVVEVAELKDHQREGGRHRARLRELLANEGF
jgi:hypothetical protein